LEIHQNIMDIDSQSTAQEIRSLPSEDKLVGRLRGQLQSTQYLYNAQPALVQRFLESQASLLAEAVVQRLSQVRFSLPDHIITIQGAGQPPAALAVPQEHRLQMAGRLRDRLTRIDLATALNQRLLELEHAPDPAVAASASLLRFATAMHMVYNMLPAGRAVAYTSPDIEDIPNIPVYSGMDPESAITATTDAIVEEDRQEYGRGELQVPYVPAARRYFLPQWVAFDEHGELLVSSANQAEAHLASMQRYLRVLKASQYLCPYIVADNNYQQKRYGIQGQLVNQGRALAFYEVREIINTILSRAEVQDLNRGLSLDLPFFNDQTMAIENWPMEIIPAGRIMFVPVFVVRAARREQSIVQLETRLGRSTRKHLLAILKLLDGTFDTGISSPKMGNR